MKKMEIEKNHSVEHCVWVSYNENHKKRETQIVEHCIYRSYNEKNGNWEKPLCRTLCMSELQWKP